MADKLMYIPNDDTQNYLFCRLKLMVIKRLNTQLNESNNQNSPKVPKFGKPTNKKTFYKTFRTSAIKSPMSLPSLPVTVSIKPNQHNFLKATRSSCWVGFFNDARKQLLPTEVNIQLESVGTAKEN